MAVKGARSWCVALARAKPLDGHRSGGYAASAAQHSTRIEQHSSAPAIESGFGIHRAAQRWIMLLFLAPSPFWHVTHIGPATVHACVRITRSKQNRYNRKTPQVRLRFMFHYQPLPNRRLINGAPRTASARPPQEKKHDKRRLSTTAATRHWDSVLLAVVRLFVALIRT